MMKKRFLSFLIALLVALVVAMPLTLSVGADFGDFGGGDDYDFDWGDDWGDDDDDWDWGDDNGGGFFFFDDSDSSSGSGSSSSVLGTLICIGVPIALILLAIILANKKGTGTTTVKARSADEVIAVDTSTLMPVSEFMQLDPSFSESALCDKMANLYVQMQNAWTARDISSLRPYFTDELFTRMERQLEQKKAQGLTNYVNNIAVLDTRLLGFKHDNTLDRAFVRLRTRIVDYTVNDKTGEVVSGSQTQEKFMTYEWELTRTAGAKTSESTGTKRINCPSCGAPLDINVSARCEYCDSVITLDSHDWAIAAIKGISQRTS